MLFDRSGQFWHEPEHLLLGNNSLQLSLESYAGSYGNPLYGRFSLCSSEGHSVDADCQDVLRSFSVTSPEVGDELNNDRDAVPQLLAFWPRTDSTHLRLSHYHGNVFKAHTYTVFLNGFGTDKTPFQINGTLDGKLCAGFVVQGNSVLGFGIHYCYEYMSLDMLCRSWKETALIWFDKLF